MARTVRDAKLETRNARLGLPIRHEPYWRSIDSGMHLGYRKGKRKVSWLARYRTETGGYHKTVLGLVDDVQDADGLKILSFSQAQEAARNWFSQQSKLEAGVGVLSSNSSYTVSDVMAEYLEWYKIHRKGISQIQYTINAHILPELGHIEAANLTHVRLRSFHETLASTPARLRTAPNKKQNYRTFTGDADEIRRRQVTANKILTIIKAALNRAYVEGRIASDEAWDRVKAFREVNAARVRYLSKEECNKLVDACNPDFRLLVQAAIITGCRYGELTRMIVGDLNRDSGTVYVAAGKNNKARHVILTEESQTFFSVQIRGVSVDNLIFTKSDGSRWGVAHQFRRLREACAIAGIIPPISFHILRHTHASQLLMGGTPLAVIAAQLGHSDTRMAEKHYAHLAPSYIAETIRAGFPKLGIL